jgi:hypothetical protein
MENKDKDIKSLGASFEVIDEAKPAAAPAAAAPPAGAPQPVRASVVRGSMGLAIGLAGLLAPYGAPQFVAVAAFAAAAAAWGLVRYGVLRGGPTALALKPAIPALVLGAGVLGLVGATSGGSVEAVGTFGNTGGGMIGAVLAVLGGLMALAAGATTKKADSKLPPAGPEPAVDHQFSVSLFCYLVILAMMPLAWSSGGGTGSGSILGVLTMLFCVMGAVASFSGMFRGWAMRGVTGGLGGMVLFLAPLEAFLYGALGVARVAMGDAATEAIPSMADVWPGGGDQDFLQYGLAPLAVLLCGIYGTVVLFQGAKKGMAANKRKKEAEIAARKAARDARKAEGGDTKTADAPKGDSKKSDAPTKA